MNSISLDSLSDAIASELAAYSEEVDNAMQIEIDELSKEIKLDLSKDKNIPKRTGRYAKSFYIKKLASGKGYKRVVIANKIYRLTHLLENGHAKIGGGRTKAYPHWKYAQEKADTLPERIERRLGK